MNFENYNKIYQEILDNNSEISANYLMNKYEISQEVELINILNQIKKNEYISSDNTLISKLLRELDENDDLLDINEIIEIKEKIIDVNFSNSDLTTPQSTQIKEESATPDIAIHNTQEIEQPEEKKSDIKNKIDLSAFITKKNLALSGLALFVLFSASTLLINSEQEDTITIEKISQVDKNETLPISNEKVALITNEMDSIVTNSGTEEKSIDNETQEVEILSIVNDEQKNTIQTDPVKKDSQLKLGSLDEIENYIKDMHFDNGNLYFNNTAYKENDRLFGFKIYKLTSMYVKFEDESNQIRKRYILNN